MQQRQLSIALKKQQKSESFKETSRSYHSTKGDAKSSGNKSGRKSGQPTNASACAKRNTSEHKR